MAQIANIANVDFEVDKELPMMKEWKSSRYFRKTVVQLRTEFRNDTESVIDSHNICQSSRHPANGLGSIPGKIKTFIPIKIVFSVCSGKFYFKLKLIRQMLRTILNDF